MKGDYLNLPVLLWRKNGKWSTRCTRLVEHFKIPLEGANAELDEIHPEFEAMVSYAGQFISLSTLDYQCVWWRLFLAPNSSEWSNALKLATLLFSLPVSKGKLKWTFSQLNNIKNKKRSSLGNQSLNDLLAVSAEKCALKDFSPDPAIKLWWESQQRRPCQSKRKQYQPRAAGSTSSDSQQESETFGYQWRRRECYCYAWWLGSMDEWLIMHALLSDFRFVKWISSLSQYCVCTVLYGETCIIIVSYDIILIFSYFIMSDQIWEMA